MKPRTLTLALTALVAGTFPGLTGPALARNGSSASPIDVRYHGGALIRHAKVVTLFWGKPWEQLSLRDYYNRFFRDLFADGRYMANLAQYSRNGYEIGNGEFTGTALDPAELPGRVVDSQITQEITAQIAAGKLPTADADTLYVVFTPPKVVVDDGTGADSENDFLAYHSYSDSGQFAYAVVPYEDEAVWGDPRLQTIAASHELAEAVTDPQPELQLQGKGGWYDSKHGEIGDIPADLFASGQLDAKQFGQILTGADGTRYVVQAEWSNQDGAPVAFGPKPGVRVPPQPGPTPVTITGP